MTKIKKMVTKQASQDIKKEVVKQVYHDPKERHKTNKKSAKPLNKLTRANLSNMNNPGKFLNQVKQAQQPHRDKEDAKPTEVRACHDPMVLQAALKNKTVVTVLRHALKNKTVVKVNKKVLKVMLPPKGSKKHERVEQERLVRLTRMMPVRLKYRAQVQEQLAVDLVDLVVTRSSHLKRLKLNLKI